MKKIIRLESKIADYKSFEEFFENIYQISHKQVIGRIIDFKISITENGNTVKNSMKLKVWQKEALVKFLK
jgi:hypothetical protein